MREERGVIHQTRHPQSAVHLTVPVLQHPPPPTPSRKTLHHPHMAKKSNPSFSIAATTSCAGAALNTSSRPSFSTSAPKFLAIFFERSIPQDYSWGPEPFNVPLCIIARLNNPLTSDTGAALGCASVENEPALLLPVATVFGSPRKPWMCFYTHLSAKHCPRDRC